MKFLRKPAIHWVRRAVQMAFLSVFILLAWAALYPPSRSIPENIFLRIDPLAAIAAARGSGIWLYLLPAWILLALTAVSGRFFCGWICPLGTILEILPSLGRRRSKKIAAMRPRNIFGDTIKPGQRRLRLKYLFLAILLVLFLVGVNLFWIFDPLVIANRAVAFVLIGSVPFMLISLMILAILVGPRFWCQEMCPFGACLSLANMAGSKLPTAASPLALVKHEAACNHCGACSRACPFEIMEVADSRKTGRLALADCALCGECVSACPQAGALNLQAMGASFLRSKKNDQAAISLGEVRACQN